MVRGPSVGSFHLKVRTRSRTSALPETRKLPSSWGVTSSRLSAGSVANSPTISSSRSTRVIIPSRSPYSSTTSPTRWRVFWKLCSCWVSVVPSGTK